MKGSLYDYTNVMKNPVSKNSDKFNRPATFIDRKKESKKKKNTKHKKLKTE